MSLEAQGAYVRLLCYCWLERRVPADPTKLARLVEVSPRRFRRSIWPALAECFQVVDGRLISPRLEQERRQASSRSAHAAKGAGGRWLRAIKDARPMPS
jgi:uncharacterized protein YdaU (DUF1376 family)